MKPRIYWAYYPKIGCGYWRVSQMPKKPITPIVVLWRYAHNMAAEMNAAINHARWRGVIPWENHLDDDFRRYVKDWTPEQRKAFLKGDFSDDATKS